jgi:signal transduction histidine kinase
VSQRVNSNSGGLPSRAAKLISPTRAWWTFCLAAFVVLLGAVGGLWWTSATANERLVEARARTLLRARWRDLEAGDFRAVVETLGRDAADVWVRIEDGRTTFESGGNERPAHCSRQEAAVAGGEGRVLRLTLCQPFSFPWLAVGLLFAAFAVSSLVLFALVRAMERGSVEALARYLRDVGLSAEKREGLFGILERVKSMASELEKARRREVELARAVAQAEQAQQIAHDLRSPLEVLRTLLGRATFSDGRAAALAERAFRRLGDIAGDLLRPSPEGERSLRPCSLWAATQEVAAERSLTAPRVSLVVEREDAFDEGWARAEPEMLRRVLSNLLDNAIEAAGVGGNVRVTLCRDGEDTVVLTIADSGPGFPRELLARLGEKGATFGKPAGTGLGLHHAQKTFEHWGGVLTIDPGGNGTGATVTARLPRVPAVENPDYVLIDDDPLIHDAWKLSAETHGKRVATFFSADEFLAFARGARLHTAVYVDLHLDPPHDGVAVAERLHALGYRDIYLATGALEPPRDARWVRAVRGKRCPWEESSLHGKEPITV